MPDKKPKFKPVYWSVLIFLVAELFMFAVATRENGYLNANNIYVPPQPVQPIILWPQPATTSSTGVVTPAVPATSSIGFILLYFASLIIVIGLVLFFIPLSALKFLFRVIFAFLFAWGVFILGVFWLPLIAAVIIALAAGIGWLFFPRVWLHNLVMIIAMASVAAIFGRFVNPWTAMVLLLALAIYDFFAVRFGYMLWMAQKMSKSTTLPAFILPHHGNEWTSAVRQVNLDNVAETKPEERDYSILGGGDIAFPLLLTASIYFARGLGSALLIALFCLGGLWSAYFIQSVFLKGKPMPALPPIAALALVSLLIILYA